MSIWGLGVHKGIFAWLRFDDVGLFGFTFGLYRFCGIEKFDGNFSAAFVYGKKVRRYNTIDLMSQFDVESLCYHGKV